MNELHPLTAIAIVIAISAVKRVAERRRSLSGSSCSVRSRRYG